MPEYMICEAPQGTIEIPETKYWDGTAPGYRTQMNSLQILVRSAHVFQHSLHAMRGSIIL